MPHSDNGPLVKRQKRQQVAKPRSNAAASGRSRIFAPFRTVGLVSPTNVPFTSVPLGKATFQITTSVGRSLQTYDLKRGLNLVFVTRPQTPRDITATLAHKQKVYAAWGGNEGDEDEDEEDEEDEEDSDRSSSSEDEEHNTQPKPSRKQGFWVYQRGRKLAEIPLPRDLDEPIRQIIVFGSWIVGLARTRIEVWKSVTLEHYTTLQPTASQPGGNELTGGMCTMPTFTNKIFVGRRDGWVEIWNVSSGKLVYTIVPPSSGCGAVTALEPTPALACLAIAYAAGPLVIQDIVYDRTLLALDAGTSGITEDGENDAPVNSISFRTDNAGAGQDGRLDGVMATATAASGDVTFWDLNKGGRIMGVLRSAHNPPSAAPQEVAPLAPALKALAKRSNNKKSTLSKLPALEPIRGGISKIEFLPGQPVILTSGLDNSLKSWIFDETPFSPTPRQLHIRSGHAAPVTSLEFLPSDFDGADGGNKWLLSAGRDRSLWGWSLRRDGQSSELSQGNIRNKAKKAGVLSASVLRHGPTTTLDDLKAPEITCIASSLNRDGGIGAMPGKQRMWQKVGVESRNKGNKSNKKGGPSETELSAATGWESVVTAHKDDAWARTWFWGRKRAGRWAFPTGDRAHVSTVAISPCGSFALVGSAEGSVDMYNLQSGLHRQRFPSKLTPAQARQLKMQQHLRHTDAVTQLQSYGDSSSSPAGGRSLTFMNPGTGRHTKAVTGLVVDSMDKYVVSCSLDGTIKFWDFLTGHLIDQVSWAPMTAITGCRYHAANDLLAFSCDDGAIRVVDLETRKTIREFWVGATATVNDFCFSNDGRWIVAVSQEDARLRVWDLSTSHLIDSVVLERPGRSVAFSATGEYLAVAPDGSLGVDIWTNKTLFKHVPTRKIVEEDADNSAQSTKKTRSLAGPTASGEGGVGLIDAAYEKDDDDDEGEDDDDIVPTSTVDQLSADMTTLSLVPRSHWQTLLHLDTIKQRNKPKEAPKKPAKVPFFIGTVGSADIESVGRLGITDGSAAGSALTTTTTPTPAGQPGSDAASASHILKFNSAGINDDPFTRKLHEGAATGDFTPFIEHFKTLMSSQADLALRSLSSDGGENNDLVLFVRAMTARLRARRDYELVQAWMTVFLRLHGADVVSGVFAPPEDDDESAATLQSRDSLEAALAEWRTVQEEERSRLDALVGYCGGVLSFVRNPRT